MTEIVTRQIETENHEYVVAESEGHVFGCLLVCYYLSTWAAAPYAMLQDFIVQEAWRDQGVGSTIFAYARARARLKGCVRIDAIVQASSQDAKRFFRRRGFGRIDRELLRLPLARSRNGTG
jgi:N-acetylglutamate synthase-like GNAT family acetyltransferase